MNIIVKYLKELNEKEATKFLVIFYCVGIAGFLIPFTRDIFELMIPVSLCINLFLIFLFHRPFNTKHILFFIAVVIFTFCIEAIGVKTGAIFGEYYYGKSLSLKILETPVIIGFNWLMLTYGVVQLLRNIPQIRRYTVLIGASILTGYDFLIEPVAMKTDMWSWLFNKIPMQNYIAWFIIAAIVISCFELLQIKTGHKIAGRIVILQGIFFATLNLFLK